jgi:hypothetical protein
MRNTAPGKRGASTMPRMNWRAQRPSALVQAKVAAEIPDQRKAATGKKTLGDMRVINMFDGS